jgi:hypothetical protein
MHEGDPPKRARRPRAKPPGAARRKPPRKTEESVVRPAIAGGIPGRAARGAPETSGAPPPFDSVLEYRESLVDDFDALASDYPRSAVLGAFLIGIAAGLLVAALSRRD